MVSLNIFFLSVMSQKAVPVIVTTKKCGFPPNGNMRKT